MLTTTTSLRSLSARRLPALLVRSHLHFVAKPPLKSTRQTRRNSSQVEPPPAGGHAPLIAESKLLKSTRDSALRTAGISWVDEDTTSLGGRETRKMNTYQAVRDAMR